MQVLQVEDVQVQRGVDDLEPLGVLVVELQPPQSLEPAQQSQEEEAEDGHESVSPDQFLPSPEQSAEAQDEQ